MKKIGIVTYYKIYNYGSILQAYALSEKINSLGYESEIIDYLDDTQSCFSEIKKKTYRNRILTSLKSPFLFFSTISTKLKGNKFVANISSSQKQKFDDFMYKYLKLSKTDILNDKDYFSGFVCGSDQVWQLSAPGLHELYYLRFTSPDKRIAYAPSFGSQTIPWYNKKRLIKYLSEFSNISVRENSGVEIIKNLLNIEVPQVLDPVLLVENSFWNQFITSTTNKYIVGYFIGDISNYIETIQNIEKKVGTKMILINSGKKQNIDRETIEARPEEFVNLIANSEYVLTDSLHGTEFAIVFKKNFLVLERNYVTVPEQKTRLISLLQLLNLENRYKTSLDKVDELYIENINYNTIDQILNKERKKSNLYLSNALNKLK